MPAAYISSGRWAEFWNWRSLEACELLMYRNRPNFWSQLILLSFSSPVLATQCVLIFWEGFGVLEILEANLWETSSTCSTGAKLSLLLPDDKCTDLAENELLIFCSELDQSRLPLISSVAPSTKYTFPPSVPVITFTKPLLLFAFSSSIALLSTVSALEARGHSSPLSSWFGKALVVDLSFEDEQLCSRLGSSTGGLRVPAQKGPELLRWGKMSSGTSQRWIVRQMKNPLRGNWSNLGVCANCTICQALTSIAMAQYIVSNA